VPAMNPYPGKNSVLVLDNARIHRNDKWISIVEELGGHVVFLPPYSPDFNPIETAFSLLKNWLRKNRKIIEDIDDDIYVLEMGCAQITPDLAKQFFHESIYMSI
jgi:transposase